MTKGMTVENTGSLQSFWECEKVCKSDLQGLPKLKVGCLQLMPLSHPCDVCLCVGDEGQILLPWMHSSWTKLCWTLRSLSTQTANCSPWGSLLLLKVHTQNSYTQRHIFLITCKDILELQDFSWGIFKKRPKTNLILQHFFEACLSLLSSLSL